MFKLSSGDRFIKSNIFPAHSLTDQPKQEMDIKVNGQNVLCSYVTAEWIIREEWFQGLGATEIALGMFRKEDLSWHARTRITTTGHDFVTKINLKSDNSFTIIGMTHGHIPNWKALPTAFPNLFAARFDFIQVTQILTRASPVNSSQIEFYSGTEFNVSINKDITPFVPAYTFLNRRGKSKWTYCGQMKLGTTSSLATPASFGSDLYFTTQLLEYSQIPHFGSGASKIRHDYLIQAS